MLVLTMRRSLCRWAVAAQRPTASSACDRRYEHRAIILEMDMLRVTVELLPSGFVAGRRVLATADISRIRSGALADYLVEMEEDLLPETYSGNLLA